MVQTVDDRQDIGGAGQTLRRRLLAIPGRLTRSARRLTLHLPTRWPWRTEYEDTLQRLRAIPAIG